MKKIIAFALLIISTAAATAQTKFGIVTYTAPAGWQATQQHNAVVLQSKQAKGNVCRITISATEKAVVSNTTAYILQRQNKSPEGLSYNKNTKSVVQKDAGGLTCFYSASNAINEGGAKNFFYSFTNGQSSFFVQLYTNDAACITAFTAFLTNMFIDTDDETGGSTSKAKRARKAAPAAPAAPAPMM